MQQTSHKLIQKLNMIFFLQYSEISLQKESKSYYFISFQTPSVLILIQRIRLLISILLFHSNQIFSSSVSMILNLNEKLISLVQKKMTSEENILGIVQNLYYFAPKSIPDRKFQNSLIITTNHLFFIFNAQIKRIMDIKLINYMTLAILGQQVILHCQKGQPARIQSSAIISIIGNILRAKQKFLLQKQSFTIHLQIQRTLQNFIISQNHVKSFFSLFSKKKDEKSLTASGRRVSFSTVEVNQKNFILQIGKKAYKAIFQNAQLLHISGEAGGFRFDAQNYMYRDLSQNDTLYWKQDQQGKITNQYLRRKINKVSKYQTQQLRKTLSNYKFNNYNEDIIYALQLDTHFQILTQVLEGWVYCWQYLIHHNNYQLSLIKGNQTVPQQHLLTQTQLRSIFYKLHTFIEQQSQKNVILCSLSLDYIYINNEQARISTFFCHVLSRINISYIAPEQFKTLNSRLKKIQKVQTKDNKNSFFELKDIDMVKKNQSFTRQQIQKQEQFTPIETYKINLWKLGMLLYQLSYQKLPFPIEYLAYKVKNNEPIKVHFPQRDHKSIEFHHFIKCLLCKDPFLRGNRLKGDARMSVLNPQISNIMEHEWVTKKVFKH